MAKGAINSVIDQQSIQSQFDWLQQQLNDLKSVLTSFKPVSVKFEGTESMRSLIDAQKQLSTSNKEFNGIQQQIFTTSSKLLALRMDEAKQLIANKLALQDQNAALKDSVKLDQAKEGSLNQLRLQLKAAQKDYDALSQAERDSASGQELLKNIQGLDGSVKTLEESTGRFQREVGNYNGAVKTLQSSLRGLGGLGIVLSRILGIDPATFESIREAGRAIRELELANRELKASKDAETISEKASTIATGENAAATEKAGIFQRAYTAIVGESTGAMKVFKLALAGLGIGIAIFGIVELVKYFTSLKTETSEAAEQQKRLNEVNEKAVDNYAAQKVEIENLVARIKDENTSNAEKRDILKEVNDKYGDQFGKLKSVSDLETTFVNKAGDFITALELKAKAQAAFNLAVEEEQKALKAQLEADFLPTKPIPVKGTATDELYVKAVKEARQKEVEDLKSQSADAEKAKDGYLKIFDDLNTQLRKINTKNNFFPSSKSGFDATAEIVKNLSDAKNAQFEIQQIIIKDSADAAKAVADNDKNSFADRLTAANNFYNASLQLIDNQKNHQLQQIDDTAKDEKQKAQKQITDKTALQKTLDSIDKKAASDKLLAETKANSDILKLNSDSEKQITKIVQDNIDQREKDRLAAFNKEKQDIENSFTATQQALANQKAKELSDLQDQLANRKVTYEQFQQDQLNIEKKYSLLSLQANIEYYKKIADAADVSEKDRADAEAKLAQVEKDYTTQANAIVLDAYKQREQALKDLHAKEVEFQKQAFDTIKTIIDAQFENQKNKIQDQIDLIDQQTQKQIDSVNQSTASEQDKAAKISIINAKAAAEKERLQQKQKQIDLEKAKFDKAVQIFQIVANTSQEVAQLSAKAAEARALAAIYAAQAANPLLTLVYGPAAGAMAAASGFISAEIPLVIGIGAAQIAAIAATPVPKYRVGTDYSPEGPAIVGEAGRELVFTPQGKINLFEKPTLTWLPEGSRVLTNTKTEALINHSNDTMRESKRVSKENFIDEKISTRKKNQQILDQNKTIIKELRKMNSQLPVNIKIENKASIDTTIEMMKEYEWYMRNFK